MFVYHLKPEPMMGKMLLPLSELKNRFNEIYKIEDRKYTQRLETKEQRINTLNCLWNDVVHFSALSPQVILDEIRNVDPGHMPSRRKYLKLAVEHLTGSSAVVFRRDEKEPWVDFSLHDHEITPLVQEEYRELTKVPEKTKAFWKWATENNHPRYWFNYVPHVLVKGQVDMSKAEILEFS